MEARLRLLIANPRGFCAGVDRAIAIVDEVLSIFGAPIFVRHQIVHNHSVVDKLRNRGVRFVDEIDEIPQGGVVVLSAHGSPPAVYEQAQQRRLKLFDATCPLVTKVHLEVVRHSQAGRTVLLVGHRNHIEVRGILGYYDNPQRGEILVVEDELGAMAVQPSQTEHIACVTQTTLAADQTKAIIDILASRFPALVQPHRQDVCYATQNRQDAIRNLAKACQLIIVVGAPHSSNSRRLVEVAERCGARAHLIESQDDICPSWLSGIDTVGLTSSASAPEHIVQLTVDRLRTIARGIDVEEVGTKEYVTFNLPASLRGLAGAVNNPDTDW
jgi:4-hydroxy-3-methylbut-2-en-1-yl diphosphate reductase